MPTDHASVSPTRDAIELDLRHLPPPEPMRIILDALPGLRPGESLSACTPCRPQPLIERLQADGYRVDVIVGPDGDARVRITPGDGRAGA